MQILLPKGKTVHSNEFRTRDVWVETSDPPSHLTGSTLGKRPTIYNPTVCPLPQLEPLPLNSTGCGIVFLSSMDDRHWPLSNSTCKSNLMVAQLNILVWSTLDGFLKTGRTSRCSIQFSPDNETNFKWTIWFIGRKNTRKYIQQWLLFPMIMWLIRYQS